MDGHQPSHHKEEKHFSASLDELRRDEEKAAKTVEAAHQDAEQIVLDGRQECQSIIEAARKEAAHERQKIIDSELVKIEAECAKVVEKAHKDAVKVRSGKDVKKAAAKLLPIVFEGHGAD